MMQLSKETMEAIDELLSDTFTPRELTSFWGVIMDVYKAFDFRDKMSDDDLIAEFKWVNEQVNKFIGTKKDYIYSCKYDLYNMSNRIKEIKNSASEQLKDRKHVVYTYIRNQWISNLLVNVDVLIYGAEEEADTL